MHLHVECLHWEAKSVFLLLLDIFHIREQVTKQPISPSKYKKLQRKKCYYSLNLYGLSTYKTHTKLFKREVSLKVMNTHAKGISKTFKSQLL